MHKFARNLLKDLPQNSFLPFVLNLFTVYHTFLEKYINLKYIRNSHNFVQDQLYVTGKKIRGVILKILRSSHPEVFQEKVLKICSKFTREQLCQSTISIKLQSNFIEITLRHGYFPVNVPHIFRTSFPKNTSGRLLLNTVRDFKQRLFFGR